MLVVENGSRDRTTEIAESLRRADIPYIQVLHSAKGKGAAVRAGMMAGRGRYLFMCDSDLSMPIEEVLKFLPPALDGYDVAIASREGAGRAPLRRAAPPPRDGPSLQPDRARVIAIPRFQDTQCGFKSFRREVAREVFTDGTMDGWAFDVEALFIALHRGYKVVAVPINWYHDTDSRVNPVQDTVRMVRDVLKIRINGWTGVYKRKKAADFSGQPEAIRPVGLELPGPVVPQTSRTSRDLPSKVRSSAGIEARSGTPTCAATISQKTTWNSRFLFLWCRTRIATNAPGEPPSASSRCRHDLGHPQALRLSLGFVIRVHPVGRNAERDHPQGDPDG